MFGCQNHELNAQFQRVVTVLDALNHYANPARPSSWPTSHAGKGLLTWSDADFQGRQWEHVLGAEIDSDVRAALINDLVSLKVGPPSCYQDVVAASDFYVKQLKDLAKKDISMVVPIYQVPTNVRRVSLADRFAQFGDMSNLLASQVGAAVFVAGGGVLPAGGIVPTNLMINK